MPKLFEAVRAVALVNQPPAVGKEISDLLAPLSDRSSSITAKHLSTVTAEAPLNDGLTDEFSDVHKDCYNFADSETSTKYDDTSKEAKLGTALHHDVTVKTTISIPGPMHWHTTAISAAAINCAADKESTRKKPDSTWKTWNSESQLGAQMTRTVPLTLRPLKPLPIRREGGIDMGAGLSEIYSTGAYKGESAPTLIMRRQAEWKVDGVQAAVEPLQLEVNCFQSPNHFPGPCLVFS